MTTQTRQRAMTVPVFKKTNTFCAMRIIPYYVQQDGKIMILLGLDSRYGEYTPFGGSCIPKKGCSEFTTQEIQECLGRELHEESKGLLNLKNIFDFDHCSYIEYNTTFGSPTPHTFVQNKVYFVEWIGSLNEKNKILESFRDKNRDIVMTQTLPPEEVKNYFEMADINFLWLGGEFQEYITNTIKNNQIQKKRIDPYFARGLHNSFFNEGVMINSPSDIVKTLAEKIKSAKCKYLTPL